MHQFPAYFISDFVKQLVEEVYRVKWNPHIVKQQRQYTFSDLDVIDYAIPCFDLSKIVNIGPDVLTRDLVKHFEHDPKSHFQNFVPHFTIEALNGYLNFKLKDSYFAESFDETLKWLKTPTKIDEQSSAVRFLAVGIERYYGAKPAAEAYAVYYAQCLWDLIGVRADLTCLVADSSQKTAATLTQLIIDQTTADKSLVKGSAYMEANRKARKYLLGRKDALADTVVDALNEKTGEIDNFIAALGIDRHDITKESDIQESAADLLDELSRSSSPGLVVDQGSRALYIDSANSAIAFRSSEGFIMSDGYVLTAIRDILQKGKLAKLIVFAQQTSHDNIAAMIALLDPKLVRGEDFILFDPHISAASMLEYQSVFSFEGDGSDLKKALQYIASLENGQLTRREVIEMISVPTDLNAAAKDHQLPIFFDLLGRLSAISIRSRSQEKVHIPTN